MLNPSLSTLAIVLGGGFAALNLPGVLNPAGFAAAARKFPRNTALGWLLTLAATAWFVRYVNLVSDTGGMDFRIIDIVGGADQA